MRPAFLLALPFLAAACVPTDPTTGAPLEAVPAGQVGIVAVNASPSRLVVRLSDGSRCVSERPDEAAAGWSGTTADCGYALPFQVTFQQGGSPDRFLIEDPSGVPGGAGTLGPRAEVFITDVSGQRRLFINGLGPNVRFETAS